MKQYLQFFFLSLIALLLWSSCQQEVPSERIDRIRIRLTEEPDRIHPMLSKTGVAAQVETKIFLPLVNADPFSLELIPVLAESIPQKKELDNGGVRLDYRIRPEARWDNGQPVTAKDVLFTYKATILPGLSNSSWRSYLNIVDSIIISEEDPLAFSVYLSEPYILAIPATGGIQVYPAHFYDPGSVLEDYSYTDILSMDSLDQSLQAFSEKFNSNLYSRDSVSGSGPYSLSEWQTAQYISLTQKQDYWGEALSSEIPDLAAHAHQLQYQIIPEESTAIALLRSGGLDVMGGVSPIQYELLKEDSTFRSQHTFSTSEVLKQYLIPLNCRDELLQSTQIRKGFAQLVDKENFIQDALQGYGIPSTGPIHPAKPYYNERIETPDFDVQKAITLFENEGWADTDGDGIREKEINGNSRKLTLTILITGSPLGESIALRLKENARKAGAEVNIETLPFRNILQKMREGDFQMTPLSSSSSPFPDDPYQSWHTSNIGGGGYNFTRFGNDRTDSIIESLRTSIYPEQQEAYYDAFQRAIADQQPAIFLAAPSECIIHRSDISIPTSVVQPGFVVNLAKPADKNELDQ